MLQFLTTWLVMILALVFLARTGPGRVIVYWLLWLAIVLLLVTHADILSGLVNPKALQLNG